MKIGNVIKSLRLMRGYNQKYMAAQLGISERQYNNIENEITNKVTEDRKHRIAEILEIDPALLREDGCVTFDFQTNQITDSKKSDTPPRDMQAYDLLIKRIEFMEKQSEEDRSTIRNLMAQIRESQKLIESLITPRQ